MQAGRLQCRTHLRAEALAVAAQYSRLAGQYTRGQCHHRSHELHESHKAVEDAVGAVEGEAAGEPHQKKRITENQHGAAADSRPQPDHVASGRHKHPESPLTKLCATLVVGGRWCEQRQDV